MLGFLYRLLIGTFKMVPPCQHEWETMDTFGVYRYNIIYQTDSLRYIEKHLCCKNCGEWKCVRLGDKL